MRIAVVGNFALTGNQTMATRALPIAHLLASRGHAVRMALPVRGPKDCPGVSDDHGVEVHQISARLPLGPECYVLQALRMLQLCLSWEPGAVYCFKPIAHSGAILLALGFLRRIGLFKGRIVLDADDWEGNGGWNDRQPFPGWVKRLFAWQEGWSLRHADTVVVASLELVRLAEANGAKEVLYLPNCLADDKSTGEFTTASGSKSRVLVYTRFVEYGLERVVATFEAILRRKPEVEFTVAGAGLNREEVQLRALLSRWGLSERVRVLGWVEPPELVGVFASAELALYLLDDNLLNRTKCPMKLVELASAGVPIVADWVGQSREYVADGETGVLVEPGDVEAMAEAAAGLLADQDLRARMASAARVRSTRWRWPAWLPTIEKGLGL